MVFYEFAILAVLMVFQTIIMIFLLRSLTKGLILQLHQLDHNLAEAIKGVLENFSGEVPDPPNCAQQFFMQLIQDRVNNVPKLVRSDDGKFKSPETGNQLDS